MSLYASKKVCNLSMAGEPIVIQYAKEESISTTVISPNE